MEKVTCIDRVSAGDVSPRSQVLSIRNTTLPFQRIIFPLWVDHGPRGVTFEHWGVEVSTHLGGNVIIGGDLLTAFDLLGEFTT